MAKLITMAMLYTMAMLANSFYATSAKSWHGHVSLVIVAMLYILAMVTALRMPAHQENRVAQFENLLAQVLRKAGWECPHGCARELQAAPEALWQLYLGLILNFL